MAKEWILNSVMNRFQLNFKRNVGATSESIRLCSPKSLDEWREYYFSKVRSQEHIKELGEKLHSKIKEEIKKEVDAVTIEDCVEYMNQLVINRTFEGYNTEIQIIYKQLQGILNVVIEPAPDEWDRLFNVDFFIRAGEKFIGLQIKPVTAMGGSIQIPELFKEKSIQTETHKKFTERFGGKVFYVYSIKYSDKKEIYNTNVIADIHAEIDRLSEAV